MSDDHNAERYWSKSLESLAGAESELAEERFNNAVNRAYYAAFQAAVAALLMEGVRNQSDRWAHSFVHSEFVGRLINRRRRYPSQFRDTLADLQALRHRADYRGTTVKRGDASQAVRRCRELIEAVRLERRE